MGKLTILALRMLLAMVLAGSLSVQVVMVPLLPIDLEELGPEAAAVRVPLLVIAVLGVMTIQVTLVCVWRLLTMVRRGTVFSHAAFRFVDVVFGAVATASLLTFGLAVILAPGEAVPPGVVLLICGASVMIAGMALIVVVLRALSVGTLAERVGITPANLAVLKNGRAKAVRFTTLAALCEALGCQPGDLLRWEPEDSAELTSADDGGDRPLARDRSES
jgi:DNA-binding Xre family transcriptional regulator